MNMPYTEEEINRGDFLHDERRDAKMEEALREALTERARLERPTTNEREVIKYALTFLLSNVSADPEVAGDMMDFMPPYTIIEDEILSAIESYS